MNAKQAINAAVAPGAWALRVKEALEAGRNPTYDDLEEGIQDLMQKNAALFELNQVLNELSEDAQLLISRMSVARHFGNTEKVLSTLDDFMESKVIIQTE